MARYIDADKIDYSMVSVYWDKDENGKDIYRRCAVAFESDIDELPTADVVKVVRCKDCKHRYSYEEFDRDTQEMYKCNNCDILHKDLGDNGFCTYGTSFRPN